MNKRGIAATSYEVHLNKVDQYGALNICLYPHCSLPLSLIAHDRHSEAIAARYHVHLLLTHWCGINQAVTILVHRWVISLLFIEISCARTSSEAVNIPIEFCSFEFLAWRFALLFTHHFLKEMLFKKTVGNWVVVVTVWEHFWEINSYW